MVIARDMTKHIQTESQLRKLSLADNIEYVNVAFVSNTGYAMHLSINISPLHFRQSGFVDWSIELMGQEGNDPGYLTHEITERVETMAQVDFLNARAEVIHLGYLCGRPELAVVFLLRRRSL